MRLCHAPSLVLGTLSAPCNGGLRARRWLSTAPTTGLEDVAVYHRVADAELGALNAALEVLVEQQLSSGEEMDVDLAQGVLSVSLGRHGHYVINKQAPTRQLWWSSPLSGPKRFEYAASRRSWLNARDGQPLRALLQTEMHRLFGDEAKLVWDD
jgi:frataxin